MMIGETSGSWRKLKEIYGVFSFQIDSVKLAVYCIPIWWSIPQETRVLFIEYLYLLPKIVAFVVGQLIEL